MRLDAQNREVYTGRVTKNSVRSSVNNTLFFLLIDPLFNAIVSNKKHENLTFVKTCVRKGELRAYRMKPREDRVDRWLGCAWVAGAAWLVLQIVVETCVDGDRVTPDALVWPTVLNFLALLAFISCLGLYARKHVVHKQLSAVMGSYVQLQLLFLSCIYVCVSVGFTPFAGYVGNSFATSVFVAVALCMAPMLDACDSTQTESRCTITMLLFACICGIAACTFVFTDTIIFKGFRVTVTRSGEKENSGQFTTNGVQANVLFTVLFLLLGGLCSSLMDPGHKLMYFLKAFKSKTSVPGSLTDMSDAPTTLQMFEAELNDRAGARSMKKQLHLRRIHRSHRSLASNSPRGTSPSGKPQLQYLNLNFY
jgi:hypothetical protein